MKRSLSVALAASLLMMAVAFFVNVPVRQELLLGVSPANAAPLNPCAAPNEISQNFGGAPAIAETAWKLWVAATCPVNQNQYPFVVWEDWIEQAQMYPPNPTKGLVIPNAQGASTRAAHLLHHSALAVAKNPRLGTVAPGLLGGADQDCNKAATPPRGQPRLIICEEVRENGSAEDYIAGTDLWNRTGQAEAAANRRDIQFPRPAVEIKADWILLSSIGLTCSRLPPGFTTTIHVETIHGNCFALAGFHLMSKLLDKWIWATFEPQNPITNPNRCKVLGCRDDFGSNPAVTHGANTHLTPKLAALMSAANLAPEWYNYRLDGVQTDFFRPKLLGSSIIEAENAGVPLTQSSCISCHAVSSVKSDGTDGIKLLTSNPVGIPAPLPSTAWIRRDFLWSLSMACPNSPFPFQTCALPPER